MKELQSLGLSIELENDDQDHEDPEGGFGDGSGIESPLSLLESTEEDQPVAENEN